MAMISSRFPMLSNRTESVIAASSSSMARHVCRTDLCSSLSHTCVRPCHTESDIKSMKFHNEISQIGKFSRINPVLRVGHRCF